MFLGGILDSESISYSTCSTRELGSFIATLMPHEPLWFKMWNFRSDAEIQKNNEIKSMPQLQCGISHLRKNIIRERD